MTRWLIDTGPIVAYLNAADGSHSEVAARLMAFSGRLATTSAVITEAMYFLSTDSRGPRLLSDFVTATRLAIYDLTQPPELAAAAGLMEKHADTPMDFADATLVLLSEGLDVRDIATLDRRGFSTYRTRRRRAFRLVLDPT